ncbi:hypothetical protein [Methylobacterium symbioticum]|uniref:Uncharacterized protein n=1 Tax=Methylobacterium symbioticum TaxID=2584084 RepID=A0A509EC38_9HYPH|nr:hypothetical protein [Methylobacterium symbioticum]VUD71817.1 hypothetical protein MET9862_02405 [Methylobacterium symbioticum]
MEMIANAGTGPADPFTWYRAALAGQVRELNLGHAPCGFFRLRRRDGSLDPVAVWPEADGTRWAKVGRSGEPQCLAEGEAEFCDRVIAFCWRDPIPEEVYFAVVENDVPWPDMPPERADDYANMPSDPLEALRIELEGERAEVEAWLAKTPISDQASADRAANWALRFADMEKRAQDGRRTEKVPHETAAKAVDARWRPVQDAAAALKARLKDAQTPFLVEKRRQEAEARAAAAQAGEALRPTTNASAGTAGRKTSLRIVRTALIEDFDAALMALRENPDLRDLVQKLANRVASSGGTLPGCRIVTTEKAA